MNDRREFYIGYQPHAPAKLARFIRRWIAIFSVATLLVAGLVAWSHRAYHPSTFEYGTTRTLEGVIETNPYPALLIMRPGAVGRQAPFSRFLLVAPGKFGATRLVEAHAGKTVTLTGNLLYQDGRSMIEVDPGSIQELEPQIDGPSLRRELGVFTLHGEIVDSKCYLGAMNPGNLKTHKACAVRCISGGIPPVLLVRSTEDRTALYFLLVDKNGGAVNERVLHMIAEPLTITGRVTQEDDLFILKANPEDYILNE